MADRWAFLPDGTLVRETGERYAHLPGGIVLRETQAEAGGATVDLASAAASAAAFDLAVLRGRHVALGPAGASAAPFAPAVVRGRLVQLGTAAALARARALTFGDRLRRFAWRFLPEPILRPGRHRRE